MSTAVKISDNLVKEAKVFAKIENRSMTGQIEHWAKIGKLVEDNPDLTFKLVREILVGLEELNNGRGTEYQFG